MIITSPVANRGIHTINGGLVLAHQRLKLSYHFINNPNLSTPTHLISITVTMLGSSLPSPATTSHTFLESRGSDIPFQTYSSLADRESLKNLSSRSAMVLLYEAFQFIDSFYLSIP
jgi:hypothetical protein